MYKKTGNLRAVQLLLGHTKLESDVGRRFRCTIRINCGELDPSAVIMLVPGEWYPHMPDRLNEDELADWRAGRNAVYQPPHTQSACALRSPTDNISRNFEAHAQVS